MKWFTTSRLIAILLGLVLIVGGGNLWATYALNGSTKAAEQRQEAAQRRQGEMELRTLCSTFGKLGALKPPAGKPGANPSRKYLQTQHVILSEISTDLRCPKGT